jgi:hypothetical protein
MPTIKYGNLKVAMNIFTRSFRLSRVRIQAKCSLISVPTSKNTRRIPVTNITFKKGINFLQSAIFYILKNYTSGEVYRSFGVHFTSIFVVEESAYFLLLSYFSYSSTLNMEAKTYPETSVDLH